MRRPLELVDELLMVGRGSDIEPVVSKGSTFGEFQYMEQVSFAKSNDYLSENVFQRLAIPSEV